MEGNGRGVTELLTQHLSEGTEVNNNTPGESISWPSFERSASRIPLFKNHSSNICG